MGYRSEIGYAVLFKSPEDREALLSKLVPEQRKIIESEALIEECAIKYRADDIKWYDQYPGVAAHEALIRAAQDEEFIEDDKGIYSLGVFVRIGEDADDLYQTSWGDYDKPQGWPAPYELVDYRRELIVGWE